MGFLTFMRLGDFGCQTLSQNSQLLIFDSPGGSINQHQSMILSITKLLLHLFFHQHIFQTCSSWEVNVWILS